MPTLYQDKAPQIYFKDLAYNKVIAAQGKILLKTPSRGKSKAFNI
jgi:hypothetical protein